MKSVFKALIILSLLMLSLALLAGCRGEETNEEICQHIGGTATCAEWGSCTKCGTAYLEPIDRHTGGAPTCNEWGKCTECGIAYLEPMEHTGGAPTCTEWGKCTKCGISYIAPTIHVEVIDSAAPATCTESGLSEGRHCSVCKVVTVVQIEIPAGLHEYSYMFDESCDNCGHIRDEQCAHARTYTVSGFAASCTQSGLSDGQRCEYCDELVVAQTATPTVQHTYDDENDESCNACGGIRSTDFSKGLEYRLLSNNTFSVVGIGSCADQNIIIPEIRNGFPVTAIGDSAFFNCESLISITIPDSITSIGKSAFSGCKGLTSITIPDSVTNIGASAFHHCTGLTEIELSDSLTSISDSMLRNCNSLTSITIPDSVSSIGNSAFRNCEGLTAVTIPDRVTGIGESAFYCCESLEIITIGKKVKSIGRYAFCSGDALTSIEVAEDNRYYQSLNGNLYSKDGKTLLQYPAGKPDESFSIPRKVSCIGIEAFYNCKNLKSITMLDNVITIDVMAFVGCTGLTEMTIPDSVTSIGMGAFYYCSGLTEVTISDSVTVIYDEAFTDCTSLISINVDENNQHYKSIDGNLYSKDGTKLIQYAAGKTDTAFIIPDGVSSIDKNAFIGCNGLTEITLHDSVTSINNAVFLSCTGLISIKVDENNQHYKSIDGNLYSKDGSALVMYVMGKTDTAFVIPDGVTSIENDAFWNCNSLTSIIIPDSVTDIGMRSFSYCSSLESVTIGSGVTSIDKSAFFLCSDLTSLTFNGTVAEWHGIVKGEDWSYGIPVTEVTCSDGRASIE